MRLEALAKKYKYKCVYCKRKYRLDELSRDHVIPINKKQRTRADNADWSNIVLACKVCNHNKGNNRFYGSSLLKN